MKKFIKPLIDIIIIQDDVITTSTPSGPIVKGGNVTVGNTPDYEVVIEG